MGVAADLARQTDPTMAAKYRRLVVERKLNHNSAVCHLAAVLATRILACLRAGTPIRSADSTDRPSPPHKAESSAKDYACNPTNGPARHAASGKRACDIRPLAPVGTFCRHTS
jgi:hypothetical protein